MVFYLFGFKEFRYLAKSDKFKRPQGGYCKGREIRQLTREDKAKDQTLRKSCYYAHQEEEEPTVLLFGLEKPHGSPLVWHSVFQVETNEKVKNHDQLHKQLNNEPPTVWESCDAKEIPHRDEVVSLSKEDELRPNISKHA